MINGFDVRLWGVNGGSAGKIYGAGRSKIIRISDFLVKKGGRSDKFKGEV